VINIAKEFEEAKKHMSDQEVSIIWPFVSRFIDHIQIDQLPKCFVHWDILKTNIIRSINGDFYIVDYSVANIYPRIQDLAVLLCNVLDSDDIDTLLDNIQITIDITV
jgi:thiamine kinase-like enzyme